MRHIQPPFNWGLGIFIFKTQCYTFSSMQFNPTNKAISLIGDIDFLLWGDSSSLNSRFSLTDRTREINQALDDLVSILHNADPNYKWDDTTNSDFPIAYQDLESGTDHYTLLDVALTINRVRIKDRSGNYKTLTPKSRDEIGDDYLNDSGTPEVYYTVANAVFPVPIPDYGYTDGVELEFQRGSNHFAVSDTDSAPGFDSRFHRYLSITAAMVYAQTNGLVKKAVSLEKMQEKLIKKIEEHYQTRFRDKRPNLSLGARDVNSYGLVG